MVIPIGVAILIYEDWDDHLGCVTYGGAVKFSQITIFSHTCPQGYYKYSDEELANDILEAFANKLKRLDT